MSSSTRSGWARTACSKASSPSWAMRTSYPSRRSTSSIDRQMSRSSSTTRMRSANGLPDALGGLQRVVGVEDGAAGDEDIGTRGGGDRCGLLVDPAIDLQGDLQPPPVDLLARHLDL